MRRVLLAAAAAVALAGAAEAAQVGMASWYGPGFAGHRTAAGTVFRPSGLTMAHRTARLGTLARVTNLRNRRVVVVRVNDRGPYHGRRVADLSQGAARRLGMLGAGLAPVRIAFLTRRHPHGS